MNCFFDTSALIKNYIEETGSEKVSALMEEADEIFVSKITIIECFSTLKRILSERLISKSDYIRLKKEILYDFEFFSRVSLTPEICEQLIDEYQLKTLDSIQLAASLSVSDEIDAFICCDNKLLKAAEAESLATLNPAV